MSKSRARLLAELLNASGRVKKDKSDLAGADSIIDLDTLPTITNAKLENSSISIADHTVSLGGSVSLNTGDITEHTDYKYYTDARARAAISVDGSLSYNSTTGVLSYTTPTTIASLSNHDTDDLAEGTNLYFTNARARGAVSVSGDLAYNSTTGVVSFTERTDAEVRGLVSAGGNLSYNSTTGVFSYTTPTTIASLSNHDTDDLAEGTNLYFTNARARSAISASGSLSYNSSTGVLSYTQPTNISTFTNDSGYLTSYTETNDLSSAVTWANVPNANITESSVTQHQAALTITESQISDLQNYLTSHQSLAAYATLASPALTGTPTAPTASAGTNTTQIATTAFVGAAVSNLVDSAPGTLNTLNELAAALGDDANFSTTVTNSIATKLPKAGGTMTGAINMGSNDISAVDQLFLSRAQDGNDYDAINIAFRGSWSNNQDDLAGVHVTDSNTQSQTVGRFGITYGSGGGSFVVTDLFDGNYGQSGDVFRVRGNGNAELQGDLIVGNNSSKRIYARHLDGKSATTNAVDDLYLQYGRQKDIRMFEASGANRKLYIYGNDNGTDRWGGLSVGTDGSFTVQASDTYLILQAASYIQSNNPHNFTSSLMTSGTTWLDANRNATFNTISSGNITSSGTGSFTGRLTTATQTWGGHITWNTGININVAGESSIDVSGSGYFQVWDSGTGAPFIKCDVGQTVEIGEAGSRGLLVHGQITSSHTDHNYLRIENTSVAKEQMVRFRNSQTNYWYAGVRTSAGIASTADFHIYSAALGDDAFALTTSGDLVAKRNLNTKTGSIQINGTTVIDSSRNVYANYSLLGRGFRSSNRGELHLNATGESDVSEIFFGYGNGYTDANIRWGISDRGSDDVLRIYRGPKWSGFATVAEFHAGDDSLNVIGPYKANGTTVIDSNKKFQFVAASNGTLASRTGFSDFIGYNPSYGSYIGGGVSNAGSWYLYSGGYINAGGTVYTLLHTGNDSEYMNRAYLSGTTTWASIASNSSTNVHYLDVVNTSASDRPTNDGGSNAYPYGIGMSINQAGRGAFQMYTPEQDGATSGGMFYRTGWNGTLRSWQRVFDDEYHPEADNADTVDNLHASQFLRSDAGDTATGNIVFSGATQYFRKNDATNYTNGSLMVESYGGASSIAAMGFHISGQIGRMLSMNNTGRLSWEDDFYTSAGLLTGGSLDVDGKRSDFGVSSNWDAVGFGNYTNIHLQGHNHFWLGAGNGTWFTGAANTRSQASGLAADAGSAHDFLVTTMYSDNSYDRGITFAVADSTSSGAAGTSGWRLGKWHSGDARDSSKFVVDGQIFAKGGYTDEYDYYGNDYSAYYSSQGGTSQWTGDGGWLVPGIVSSSAIQIQSGNGATNSRKPQLQFHQYGYGGIVQEYDGPNKVFHIKQTGDHRLNYMQVTTNYGNLQMGPMNSSYCHIYTNIGGGFYFNRDNLYANGNTILHDGNVQGVMGATAYKSWTGLNASATQAKRYTIMRLYVCPAHWHVDHQNIKIFLHEESYESSYVEYHLWSDYNGGNENTAVQLQVKDAGGYDQNRYKVTVGSPVDAGYDYAGQDVFYYDIHVDVAYYKQVRAYVYMRGHSYTTTAPTSGGNVTLVYNSPSGSNISDFSDVKDTSYFKHYKIWNEENDGAGSGLDADTLDGNQSSFFADKTNSQTFSAEQKFTGMARVVTGSIGTSTTDKGLVFDGNYQTGQYRHRIRKQDLGAGLPLFIDYAHSTANSYSNIIRIGGGGSYAELSVYGSAEVSSNITTNKVSSYSGSGGLVLGNFSTSNVDITDGRVATWLRSGTFDDYMIQGSTSRGVFGRQFIGHHFNSANSWGVFSSGWDTHLQISGDDRIYLKPNVGIGATPSTTGPVLDVYQTADRPAMTIRSSNPGNWGASLIIGNTTADQTLIDGNDRPVLAIDGQYPVINLNHTVTSNDNHGPTIQFTFDGLTTGGSTGRQIVIGADGAGNRLDFGFSGGGYGGNSNKNPHNGIAGYSGATPMRLFYNGLLLGSTGVYPNEIASVSHALDVRGHQRLDGNFEKVTYNKAFKLYSSGTASSGSAIGFQQITSEGWTGIFVDYNPYEGWGLYHDNPSNYFLITAETNTGAIGSGFTVPNRDSGTSTAYTKHLFDQTNGNYTAGGSISAQGNITAYSSDKRLKENFRPIESAIEKVKQLNGLYFDWNKVSEDAGFIPDSKENDIGLIAQDVEKVLPQAVAPAPFDTEVITTPNDPNNKNAGSTQEKISISGENYLTVKYEKLVPLLVNAIKEQSAQIDAQQEQINQLTNLVNALMEK